MNVINSATEKQALVKADIESRTGIVLPQSLLLRYNSIYTIIRLGIKNYRVEDDLQQSLCFVQKRSHG